MSLQLAAQHLASKGRGPDTTLVHMTPGEVNSLQAIARAHGGSLTINPHTGLPEAGFLSSILPMIAGVGLTAISGGTLSPLMAGLLTGGVTGLATGNLQKGLMAGLGAWGGAGLAGNLAAVGGNAATQEAIMQANPGLTAADVAQSGAGYTAPQMSMTDKMMAGVKGLGSEAGRDAFMQNIGGAKGLMKYGAAAMTPALLAQSGESAQRPSTGAPRQFEYDAGYTGAGPSRDSSESTFFRPRLRQMADGGSTGMTGQSDEYYRYLMGLAPAPAPYTPALTAATSTTPTLAAASPAQVKLTPYQQASRLDNQGPGAPTPAEVNAQAQQNMIDPVTGQPNAVVNALVPLANMLGITSPQQGATQGLLSGSPIGLIAGAILGNAAQSAQQANISSISESSGNQVGPALGGTSVQEGMLSGLDTLPDSGVEVGGPIAGGLPVGTALPSTTTAADMDDAASAIAADVAAADAAGVAAGIDPGEFAHGGLTAFAQGGYNLGDYSDGGRLLRGPGDGVSDSIPASIGNKRPARLADGEFVVPARIVSELGNGSTEAGARKLYAMMDRVQRNRGKTTGKGKVAVNSRSEKYLPA